MPLFETQHIGAVVAIEGAEAGLPVVLQAFHNCGKPLSGGAIATIPFR